MSGPCAARSHHEAVPDETTQRKMRRPMDSSGRPRRRSRRSMGLSAGRDEWTGNPLCAKESAGVGGRTDLRRKILARRTSPLLRVCVLCVLLRSEAYELGWMVQLRWMFLCELLLLSRGLRGNGQTTVCSLPLGRISRTAQRARTVREEKLDLSCGDLTKQKTGETKARKTSRCR